ncbi:MAG: hypothetical protein QF511_05300 [Rhodospirillales bacterium]|nr:hypothetical protein [Rhodospirillales bacterium]MDP7215364.1 hypothetical protein [Rhodospirillales bacterium]HJP54529.1 hypothetical protein [Rhodospirillales bacterium]
MKRLGLLPITASHSACVTSYLPAAKGRGMVTWCTGFSSLSPPPLKSPIWKLPAGTTTISGHSGQSRNAVPGVCAVVGDGQSPPKTTAPRNSVRTAERFFRFNIIVPSP